MIVSINFIDSVKNYARMSSCYMKASLRNIWSIYLETLGENMMYRIDDSEEIILENIKRIDLGTGKTYCVYDGNSPIVLIEINTYGCFTDAVIFNDYVVIGNYTEGVYSISLKDYSVKNIKIEGYYGYFEMHKGVLYVLGCENIVAFNHSLEVLWESETLAVDGVLCDCIVDDTMMISCEMDPPGGWIERKISLIDGKIIE